MTLSHLGLLAVVLATISVAGMAYALYPRLEDLTKRFTGEYVGWVVATREKMFRPATAAAVTGWIGISTGVCVVFGLLLSFGLGWLTLLCTAFCGIVGWMLPRWWVGWGWRRRIAKFDGQLVDGLNLMANSLKSGLNLPQVIQVLVGEMPEPISQEFGLVLSQQKLGLTLEEALEKLVDRMPSPDLAVAINAILILRETGGDLSETFDVIASTIRERRKVDGKIKSMTAQGRTQALLLFLMPFVLGGILYVTNPDFLTPLFTTQLGWMMLAAMFVFQIAGGLWLKKIITIDV